MVEKETRPPSRRTGLFIGACGGTVAAACPVMRFDWRKTEPSAERTEHWPLTLMNSAQHARLVARRAKARMGYAMDWLAYEIVEDKPRRVGQAPRRLVRSRKGAMPQDRIVSMPSFPCRMATGGRL